MVLILGHLLVELMLTFNNRAIWRNV